MPDGYGFDHLPHWGTTYHRCIECEWPGWGVIVGEAERKRHHWQHEKQTAKQKEAQRKENLALARKAKALKDRENSLAYPTEGEE